MKECKDFKNSFLEYYYDGLDNAGKSQLEAHLKSCETCAKEYKDMKNVLNLASKAKKPELLPSFWNKFYYEIKEKPEGGKTRKLFKLWRIPVAAAAISLLVILAVFNLNKNTMVETELDAIFLIANADTKEKGKEIITELDMEILTDMEIFDETLLLDG